LIFKVDATQHDSFSQTAADGKLRSARFSTPCISSCSQSIFITTPSPSLFIRAERPSDASHVSMTIFLES